MSRIQSLASRHNLDIWAEHGASGQVDIRFASVSFQSVAADFAGIAHTVFINDVQAMVDHVDNINEMARSGLQQASTAEDPFFNAYRTWPEILNWLNQIHNQYSSLTSLEQIGTTVLGEPIMGIHIKGRASANRKPFIMFNSLQHAREWISGATTTFIISKLVSGYGVNAQITQMVDQIDWFIIPVVNVDGYQWTWAKTGDRLWRKNRRPLSFSSCVGIDINRNWGYHFQADSWLNACQETYAGSTGFSEPENKALADYLSKNPTTAYIDFHSYSQLLMWPWAWQSAAPPHAEHIVSLGNSMQQTIQKVNGTRYQAGQIYHIIYPAYGSSVDYAAGVATVPLPYGVELRDTGAYGFLLPANQIIPNGNEIFAAVQTMASYILSNKIIHS